MNINDIEPDDDKSDLTKILTRLSTHRYHLLSEETKDRIKQLAGEYCCDRRFDPEFECFEVTWYECNWLYVNLLEPEIFGMWRAERLEHV